MPEAIATTKRKFYKALDALTATSQNQSHAASDTPTTSTTKRSSATAFEEARERVRKRLRQSTSSSSLATRDNTGSVISLPARSTPSNSTANQSPPQYSPWSQQTFLARLKTFSSVSLWHPKPDVISEVEWAKRGWVCVDVNTVSCKGGCGKRLVVSLDSAKQEAKDGDVNSVEEEDDADEKAASLELALAEAYQSAIADGHSASCLWRKAGCKDDIYRLPVVRPSIWQPQLRERFQTLSEITESIHHIRTKALDSSTERLLHDLSRDALGLTAAPPTSAQKPFEIAMHGWRGSSESGNHLLHCDACFQRIGLWMYQPEYRTSRTSTDVADDDESITIDLVDMHRDHCPWRNPQTQNATGSLSGLNAIQILHRVASTAARDHRRRSNPQPPQQEVEPDDVDAEPSPIVSREEVARLDKERESRLRKLKNLFSVKRRPTIKPSAQSTG